MLNAMDQLPTVRGSGEKTGELRKKSGGGTNFTAYEERTDPLKVVEYPLNFEMSAQIRPDPDAHFNRGMVCYAVRPELNMPQDPQV